VGGLTTSELIRRHRRIGLDSNLFIYLADNVQPWSDRVAELITAIEGGHIEGVLSAVGLTEILSGPSRDGDLGRLERTNHEIRAIPGLVVAPLGPEVAADAAVIRGIRRMTLPDAVHLATARAAGATAFVTNDRRIRGSAKLEVVYLDDLLPPAP
jgi:predicted nucleic acid-binding protein